ncbi:hypothetical protein X749_06195 [Mesorhizobium sp. LNJC391B00]|nr:hypothetical protein X749_06195 [Mesorhizobium sp. LNJC391B00]
MSLAQKDQLLEIGSRVRLGKPIIMREIERLPRQITNLSAHEVRTNLLFTMSKQNKRQAKKLTTNLYTNDFFTTSSTPLLRLKDKKVVEPDGIEPTTSCLQSRRSPS